ncbi:hypothetical protein [Flavobacterium sp. N502540]|uniref:hypothetical protein n=1 Tax=Flavobacterium sp. N502540 TaxID=2986838 RepID=UPI0022241D94|nr:hypothetical protein [Flavobacterium sp. N502540]
MKIPLYKLYLTSTVQFLWLISVMVIAKRSIIDIPTALLAIITIFTLLYIKKIQEPYIIIAAAILGIIIKLVII